MAKKITVKIPYPAGCPLSEIDQWIEEVKESFRKDDTVKKVEYLLEKDQSLFLLVTKRTASYLNTKKER